MLPALLLALSCSRPPAPALQRLAILRFENLSGNVSLDWMGRAASEVMTSELMGSPNARIISLGTLHDMDRVLGPRPALVPGISAQLSSAFAGGATRVVLGQISALGGQLRVDASVYDLTTQRVDRSMSVSGAVTAGILPLADSLARRLADRALPFGTAKEGALREYTQAEEAPDPSKAAESLGRAIAEDPNFGAAYLAAVRLAAGQRNVSEAERIIGLARARGNAIPEPDRTRLAVAAAELRGDPAETVRALENLTRLVPSDPAVYRQLAQAELNGHHYDQAVSSYQKVAGLDPEDALLWNQLGYAQVYAGNLDGAIQSLMRYARLRPSEPNPLDSLGDAYYAFSRFSEAEKAYKDSSVKDPNFAENASLLKASYARLASGDVAVADALFAEYAKARVNTNDPLIEYRRAEWEYMSGRRKQAMTRLEAFAAQSPDRAAQAYYQLAVWSRLLGDQARAREFAAKGNATATPVAAATAVVTRLIVEPSKADDVAKLAEKVFPDPRQSRIKNLALMYAFLVNRDYAKAAPLLQDAYDRTPPTPEQPLYALLAWAKIETGQAGEAAKLLARNPVPNPAAGELFAALHFPRLFFLRAEALRQSGRRDEAAKSYRLFLQLSGETPENFGQEQRARQALDAK